VAAEAQPLGVPRSDLAAATIGIERVPDRFRVLGFLDYFVLWADLGVGLLVLLAGTALVPGLGFSEAILAILVGTLIGNVMLGLAGVVGSDLAVPSMVSLRPSFGQRGSYLPSLINVIQLVGWGAFELVIMAQASARITQSVFGVSSYAIWAVVWGVVITFFALGGPLVIVRQWLEKAGIWIVLATAAWMTIYVFTHANFATLVNRPGDGSLTFAQAVDLVVAMPISWLPLVADFNRFAKSSRSSFWGTVSGFAVSNVLFFTLGVLLILVLPTADLIGSIMTVAFGAAGLALLLGDETDNAFADVYSGAISIKNVVPALPTRALVAAIGGLCLAIALTANLSSFQGFLYLVGSLFTPLFGVVFADYFLLRRRRYETADLYPQDGRGRFRGGINPVALVAWGCGIAAYLAETTCVGWLGGTLPSLAVSLAVYLALSMTLGRTRRRAAAWASRSKARLRAWTRHLSRPGTSPPTPQPTRPPRPLPLR
jgi:putative hydroxymethylpyrimidine transporter CytX